MGGDGGLALLHERQCEQRAALHGVAKTAAALVGLGYFLEFADGFLEQTHFPKGDAQIVVSLQVFLFGAHFAELGAKFLEHFLERSAFKRRFGGFGRRRRGMIAIRRRSWLDDGLRRNSRRRGSKLPKPQLLELLGQIGKEL